MYVGLCTGCGSHQRSTPTPDPTQSQAATEPSPVELVPGQSTPITVPMQEDAEPWETPEGLLQFIAEHQLTDKERQRALQKIDEFHQPQGIADWQSLFLFSEPLDPHFQLSQLEYSLQTQGKITDAMRLAQLIPTSPIPIYQTYFQTSHKNSPSAPDSRPKTVENSPNRDDPREIIAKVLSHSGVDVALTKARAFEESSDRDIALSGLIPYLLDQNKIDEARKLAEELHAPDQRGDAWGAIACRLVQKDQLKRALQMAEIVKDPRQQNRVRKSIVLELIALGQFEHARKLCAQVKNEKDDSARDQCFSALVTRLSSAGQLEQAIRAFDLIDADSLTKMLEIDKLIESLQTEPQLKLVINTAQQFKNSESRELVLAAVSDYLADQGQFLQARDILALMKTGYEKADAVSHLANLQFQSGQLEQTVKLLQEHADSDPLAADFEPQMYHDANHQWYTTVPLYEKLLTALVTARKPEQALQLAETLQDGSQKMEAIQFLIQQLAKAGYYDRVIELGFNYTTDENDLADLQPTAIESLVDAGEYQRAIDLARLTQDEALLARAGCRQVKRLIGQGKLESAQQLAETIDDPEWKTESQLAIIATLIEQRQFSKAIRITQKMENYSRLKTKTEQQLVTVLLERNRLTEATDVASGIWKSSARLAALFDVASQLASESTLQSNLSPDFSYRNRRLKTSFTPAEQQLARRIVKAIDRN